MTFLNPCGTESLEMAFALIAKVPIEHYMITRQAGELFFEVK